MPTTQILTLTALEDLRYRVMGSYPPDGFPLKKGQTIKILSDVLKFVKFKNSAGRNARYVTTI